MTDERARLTEAFLAYRRWRRSSTGSAEFDLDRFLERAREPLVAHLQRAPELLTAWATGRPPQPEVPQATPAEVGGTPPPDVVAALEGLDPAALRTAVETLDPSAELVSYLLADWPSGLDPLGQYRRIGLALEVEDWRRAEGGAVHGAARSTVAEHVVLRLELGLSLAPGSIEIDRDAARLCRELEAGGFSLRGHRHDRTSRTPTDDPRRDPGRGVPGALENDADSARGAPGL